MDVSAQFREIASLIGEPSRAAMLYELFDGRAFSAGELAISVNITPQSASMHLKKLVEAGILQVKQQGKCRHYSYAKPEVAAAVEALANLVSVKKSDTLTATSELPAIKAARSCYDHLAGKLGVAITNSLLRQKVIVDEARTFTLTKKGEQWFNNLGIDAKELKKDRRPLILKCIDWTEQQPHIAGSLGAALLKLLHTKGWVRKQRTSRVLIVTGEGKREIEKLFNIQV